MSNDNHKSLDRISARLPGEVATKAEQCFAVLNEMHRKDYLKELSASDFVRLAVDALYKKLKSDGILSFCI